MKKLLFIFLLSTLSLSSQERKALYGTTLDAVKSINNAHIINLNTGQGTLSNNNGEFRIFAQPKDSIKISFLGYETKIWVITLDHFGIQKNKITLIKTPIELDEVKLRKNNFLGYIETDVNDVKIKEEVSAESLNLPYAGSRILTVAERRLHTATTSSGGIPIDPLLNWISGRTKKLKKLKVIEDKEKRILRLFNNYKLYINQELKILNEDTYLFVSYCEEDKDFNSLFFKDQISMAHFLQDKSEKFKKLNPKKYN